MAMNDKNALSVDIDIMRDVYMLPSQQAAHHRIVQLALAHLDCSPADTGERGGVAALADELDNLVQHVTEAGLAWSISDLSARIREAALRAQPAVQGGAWPCPGCVEPSPPHEPDCKLTQPQPVDDYSEFRCKGCGKRYCESDCEATPPESGGQGEAVVWLEPHHLGALRKRRQNKEAGYILVEVCDSETEDYCVPLYTHPPAQPDGVGK